MHADLAEWREIGVSTAYDGAVAMPVSTWAWSEEGG
jgi:hypothetical protein